MEPVNFKLRVLLLTLALFFPTPVLLNAAEFKIKPLVVTGSPAPGGETFIGVGIPRLNDKGDVGFGAITASSSRGLYVKNETGLSLLYQSATGTVTVSRRLPDPSSLGLILLPSSNKIVDSYGMSDNDFWTYCYKQVSLGGVDHINDSLDVLSSGLLVSGGSVAVFDCPTLDYLAFTFYDRKALVRGGVALGITNSGTMAFYIYALNVATWVVDDYRIVLIDSAGSMSMIGLVGTPVPGGAVRAIAPGAINNNGDLVLPYSTSTSFSLGSQGLLLVSAGSAVAVAFTGMDAPGGGKFVSIAGLQNGRLAVNDLGQVAFAAALDDGSSGIFRREPDGTITTLARDRTSNFAARIWDIAINARGDVAAWFYQGFYTPVSDVFFFGSAGHASRVAGINTPAPDGGKFLAAAYPQINNKGEVIFYGVVDSGKQGIFIASQGLETEFVDPVPDLLADATITSDETKLAEVGRSVNGIAADGAARVVVRVKTGQPGNVEFSLVDESGAPLPASNFNGSLSQVSDDVGSGSVSVETTDVQDVGPMAFAVYHAPMDFATSPDSVEAGRSDRQVYIKVKLTTSSDETVESTAPLKIVRPPVVLVHGLWGSRDSWDVFEPPMKDKGFFVERIDYRETHAAGFNINAPEVNVQLKDVIKDYKTSERVAAIQADAVTHSMGGLLIRMLPLLGGAYFRNDNFQRGDVHRLMNIATPHFGSELARLLRNDSCVNFYFSLSGNRTDQGGVDNLVPGSEALNEINGASSPLPLHNVIGIASRQQVQDSENAFWLRVLRFLCRGGLLREGLDAVHRSQLHDLVVDTPSQQGAVLSISPVNGVIHTRVSGVFVGLPELESSVVSGRIINLLNSPLASSAFTLFSPTLNP